MLGVGVLATRPLLGAIGRRPPARGLVPGEGCQVGSSSISGIVKAEMFPVQIRGLAVGLPYAISNALFGGTAEYVALWFKNRGVEASFYWYVTVVAGIGLIATLVMPDNRVNGYLRDDKDGASDID